MPGPPRLAFLKKYRFRYLRHSYRHSPYNMEVQTNMQSKYRNEQCYYSPHELRLAGKIAKNHNKNQRTQGKAQHGTITHHEVNTYQQH